MRPAALLLLSVSLLSQGQVSPKSPVEESGTASIVGVVVEADTGEPLKRATVALWSEEIRERYGAQCDSQGRFRVLGIRAGRYHLSASHPRFIEASYGETPSNRRGTMLLLEKRQEVRDVVFRLRRPGVITGRVVDEEGQPVRVRLIAWAFRGRGASRQLMGQSEVDGNDLGEYRMFDLQPGKYYVSVVSLSNQPPYWAQLHHSNKAESKREPRPPVYPPIFYPQTTDPSQATAVEVKAGEELRLDFTLIPVSPYRVRGRILALPVESSERFVVLLISRGFWGRDQMTAAVQSDGSYEFPAVIPGSYQITVSGGSDYYNPLRRQAAKRPVEVTNSDIDNLDLILQPVPKIVIKGRITVEGEPAPNLDQFSVHLIDGEEADPNKGPWGHAGAQVEPDGSFSVKNVVPGEYVIQVNSRGYRDYDKYYISVARSGTRQLVDSKLTVTEATPPRLELALSSATARLEGMVVDEKDKPVAGPTVVAVSQTLVRGHTFSYRTATTDQNGKFVLPRLKPDTYKVFAFADGSDVQAVDSEFLEKHGNSGASAVIQAGGTVTVNVKLIPTNEEEE